MTPPTLVWLATGLMPHVTGIERMVISTVSSARQRCDSKTVLVVDDTAQWANDLGRGVEIVKIERPHGGVARAPKLPTGILAQEPTVAHSFGPPFPLQLEPSTRKSYTVHDWGPFTDHSMPPRARAAWMVAIVRGVRAAGLIHFYSSSTAAEAAWPLRKLLDGKEIVTGLPYRAATSSVDLGHRSARTTGFVLSVGSNVPRKRFALVAEACARLPRVQFVAIGDGTEALNSYPRAADVSGWGRVSDAKLRDAYRTASLLVLASRYEGFGLPVLEAWEAGCPVLVTAAVASRLPSEVQNDAIVVPTDLSVDVLAHAIRDALGAGSRPPTSLRGSDDPILLDHILGSV